MSASVHTRNGDQHPPDGALTPSRSDVEWARADALVLFHADLLDDYEAMRIATGNRLGALTSDWGKGISTAIPEVAFLEHHLEQIKALEHGAELALKRVMRTHPLAGWVKRTVGVGEKQAARLLAAIGDPGARPNPAKLWAYCGLHVVASGPARFAASTDKVSRDSTHTFPGTVPAIPSTTPGLVAPDGSGEPPSTEHAAMPDRLGSGVAPSRRRGQRANWSTKAKTRCWLVATSCIKHRTSPYRAVYDAGRAKYADRDLTLGHEHARALRLVMKRILLDLWREARALRLEEAA